MKLDHISKIKGNVGISSNLKATNILDGSYKSIFKGKSLNFEELREYNIGDNIKDIDWRASARSMNVLVREHVAEKKHNIFFILDSSFDMNANANKNDLKRDIAISLAGTIAYLAYKNGDYTGAIYSKNNSPKFFPLKQTLFHIENYLTFYEEDLKNQKIKEIKKYKNSLNDSIKYLASYLRKKSIIFIISDLAGFDELDEDVLKLLSYRNDIMAIEIGDTTLFDNKSYDIDNRKYFAPMFSKNKKLAKIDREIKETVYINNLNKLRRYRIALIHIDKIEDVVPKIIELLKLHNEMIYK